ncbi:MAG: energy transducer TonB, partial [Gammaproteobacteria bacterium]|nr:energy transducer TonB [Gammaproteobacteria bacterium]
MTAATVQPLITPADRFGVTLCLAIITHGIVILGVTFAPEDALTPRYETMEIILVQEESKPPENASFLAQANLEGGGDSMDPVTPATPLPAPFPEQEPDITAPPELQAQPPAEASPPVPETAMPETEHEPVETTELLGVEKTHPEDPVAATSESTEQEPEPVEKIPEQIEPDQEGEKLPMPEQAETPPMPSATALLTNSFKIASLSAEIRRKMEAKAERPRRKFISASTKEFKYAAYMEAWRVKVERVGNLNYPDDARKNKLTGSLILDVALNADGSVNEITIRRSSGTRILDDAAMRIVELSSPFAAFPDQIRKETDILHITRTW